MKLFNDLSLQFNLRKEQRARYKHQIIYCRINCGKNRKNISSGIYVLESSWCKQSEKVKSKEPNSSEINEQLTHIKQQIISCYFEAKANKKQLTINEIQSVVFKKNTNVLHPINKENDSYSRILANRYINDLNEKKQATIISDGTYKSYKSAIVIFLKFAKMYYGTENTCIKSIDKQFFFHFENHLTVKMKYGNNYTHKVLSNTRKLFNYAYDLGIIDAKCSFRFKVKYVNPYRAILNYPELKSLIHLEINNQVIEEGRDCFLFQCYTGLAYAEIKGLRSNNIKNIEGEKWLVINRQKTGSESKLILLPIAEQILEKYANHPYCIKTKQLLPVKSNVNYNHSLKEVQKMANLTTRISSHIGRHIFATTVALQFGLPIETLAKVLGHTNLRTTMIYGKILDNKIQSDFAALKGKLL
jgi:site-specific recombinase XerD